VLECIQLWTCQDMADTMSEADSFQDVADESHTPKVNWPASDVESFATEESSWLVVEQEDSEIEGWEKEDAPGAPGEKMEPAIFHSAREKAETPPILDDTQEEAEPTPAEAEDQDEPAKEVPQLAVACMASGKLLAAQPLMLGSGQLLECYGESGDVTARWSAAFESFPGVSGAYCLGRIAVAVREAEAQLLPVVASVVVLNDGAREWSAGTALRIVAGDAHGFDMMPAGPLAAGQAAELRLDLLVPTDGKDVSSGCGKRSAWVLTDEFGEPFGPLLVLEVVWM